MHQQTNMKKSLFLSLLTLVAFSVMAQKTINDANAELRSVGSFTGVAVSGGIDIYLSAGDEAVAVSAGNPEHTSRILTEVKDGVLKIWYDSKGININIGDAKRRRAYVSYKTLKTLSASGGSDVAIDGVLTTPELRLDLSGGSDFKGKVDVENLRVTQSGGCDVHIAGKATTLTVDASSGSDFNGYDLVTEICNLQASGGCDIEITANKELSARASGASDIHYKGQPNVKEAKASGASSVKSRS